MRLKGGFVNCKEKKDVGCELCTEKRCCSTYLEIKPLNEYSNVEKEKYSDKIKWEKEMPIIATAIRHPFLGVKIKTNVLFNSVPEDVQTNILKWANSKIVDFKLKKITDFKGVTTTF